MLYGTYYGERKYCLVRVRIHEEKKKTIKRKTKQNRTKCSTTCLLVA